MTLRLVTLRNGREVAEPLVATTLLAVDKLASDPMNLIPLFELVTMAGDSTHQPFGNTGEVLERFGLLNHGRMPDDVRAIVNAAYEIDGLDIVKRNPLAASAGLPR